MASDLQSGILTGPALAKATGISNTLIYQMTRTSGHPLRECVMFWRGNSRPRAYYSIRRLVSAGFLLDSAGTYGATDEERCVVEALR